MALFKYFFSFDGRIQRRHWWLARLYWIIALIVIDFAIVIPMVVYSDGQNVEFPGAVQAMQVIIYWIMALSLNVRRFRDRGKSGLWGLIMFVPIIGPIWVLVECGFLRGTDQPSIEELASRFD